MTTKDRVAEKVIEKLEEAADLIEAKGWTRKHYAVDDHGEPCYPDDPHASKFCLKGAVIAAFGGSSINAIESKEAKRAINAISSQIEKDYRVFGIAAWNDRYAKDGRQVVRLIRRTARNLRKKWL